LILKPMKRRFTVPIYDVCVWIIVSEDIILSRTKMNHIFENHSITSAEGICSWNQGTFGLFFKTDTSLNTIVHEIYHLTTKILSYYNISHEPYEEEHWAIFNAYLIEKIFGILGLKMVSKTKKKGSKNA